MRSMLHPKLGLGCGFAPKLCVQRSIGRLLSDVSRARTVSEKVLELDDCVNRLQGEMKKIDAFKRELPLCMLLLSDAILAAQEERAQCNKLNSEPVLEEFIPLANLCGDEKVENSKGVTSSGVEKDGMTSLQLWSADDQKSNSNTADHSSNRLSSNTDTKKKKRMGEEINHSVKGDLFQSFKGCPSFAVMEVGKGGMEELAVPGLSLCTPGTENSGEAIDTVGSSYSRSGSSPPTQASFKAGQLQAGRKQRRCWSAELHRQFINALQHLGGPQAATPKQIREHMQVDGLTNDEVKSHLQKYRLHMRRVSTSPTIQEQFGESLKQSSGKSGSPPGPLHLCRYLEGEGMTLENEDD